MPTPLEVRMYIEPNSNIRLLHNVPLDTTYDHTLYFATAEAQASYFMTLQKYNLDNYSYQRAGRGFCRVGINSDNLYDCNYMMFQNTSFGTKWFYAFIRSVDYVNNETAQINFEIDDMQTWLFDASAQRNIVQPEHCFVEREHSLTDNIGDNIVPESLALGEYVFNSYDIASTNLNSFVVIAAIVDVTTAVAGRRYDGIYGGATLYAYSATDASGINNLISGYLQKPESIIGLYMVPRVLIGSVSSSTDPADHILPANTEALHTNINLGPAITKNDTLDGYLPKNAKMYTYPYNYMHVSNGCGSSLGLRYEFFSGLRPTGELTGCITQPVKVSLRPTNYKNIVGSDASWAYGTNTVNSESLELSNYPLCSWNMDAYKAWVAQNSIPLILGGINSGVDVAASIATGKIGSGAKSAIGAITETMTKVYQASIAADISSGSVSNGSGEVGSHKKNFFIGRVSVQHEFARMIDDYFTMFGYAVNRCKVPNTHSRPRWNYVKTVGCVMNASIPSDAMRHICQIYDHGVTFWKNGAEVGRYDLPNSPA